MPLPFLIVWLGVAGCMMLVGTAITVRRYFDNQKQRARSRSKYFQDVATCSYCEQATHSYIHLTLDGVNYIPVCFDCQCQTGIVNPDGTTSKAFYYQVAECDRI